MSGGEPLVAGVELGGTKCIAILARGEDIVDEARWPTLTPAETLPPIVAKLRQWRGREQVAGLGIASFGPLSLAPGSTDFGRIVNTPKPTWSGVDVRGILADDFAGAVGFDTDVAGAAMAEWRWGAAVDCNVHAYVTVGTGVGGAVAVRGQSLHHGTHPEIGHVRVRRRYSDPFRGLCPFHGDCIEGLVSGPAISARAGEPVDHLAADDPVWDLVAAELAKLMAMLILTVAPQRIVIGGGVAERRPMLFPRVHATTAVLLNDYVAGQRGHELQRIIVPPRLGNRAGPLGAIALGLSAILARPDLQ